MGYTGKLKKSALYIGTDEDNSELLPGSEGQILSIDALGNLVWVEPSSGSESSKVTTFDTSGIWNKDPRSKTIKIYAWGAGGGGGSGRCGNVDQSTGGGGGCAGGFSHMCFDASKLSNSYNVTIGIGGNGGTSVNGNLINGNNGTDGGKTFVEALIGCTGGEGGKGGTIGAVTNGGNNPSYTMDGLHINTFSALNPFVGGIANNLNSVQVIDSIYGFSSAAAGGAPYISSLPINGPKGGDIIDLNSNILRAGGKGGDSGSYDGGDGANYIPETDVPIAIGGAGGGGGGRSSTSDTGNGGNGGTPAGGGGGGSANLNNNPSGAGGNGGNGKVIIIEYF